MDILNTIERLQEKRRSDKITPDHVPENDLMRVIHEEEREELNLLFASGKIGITKTVNSRAVFIKK